MFSPEIHPSARIILELAQALTRDGNSVSVATGFPHHPHGRVLQGYKKRLLLRECIDGIQVFRGWHMTSASPSIGIRGLVYVSQALGTAMAALVGNRPDVVINFGPPLVGPSLSKMISMIFSARLITVIYDLYPDVAIETGAVKKVAVIRAAKAMERWIYRTSDRIVVLSEGFRKILFEEKGVPREKVRVIPVWIDPDEIRRTANPDSWRSRQGIPASAFVVLYAGTIGLVSGAEVMVKVAREWAGIPEMLFLFVGEGRVKEKIMEEASDLSNVGFFDFQPREDLAEMLSSADVGVMTLLPGRGRTSVPSKVLGYMAAEVPVLASCDPDSDSADMIREADCGIAVPPGDPQAISEALRKFYDNREFGRGAGRRGRLYLEKYHSRESGTKAFCDLVGEFA